MKASTHHRMLIGSLAMVLIILFFSSCKEETLFREISPDQSGIEFSNDLTWNNDFNIFRYRNFYNGGGVGLGDFNNDGLLDIYMVANMTSNKLYFNQGNFSFADVTDKAEVGGTQAFATGVSIADVNGDGWLDIYLCNSGDIRGDEKINELFINNGDSTFTERAEEYGLADRGFSTHAAFFDYDRDGDLDMYLMNNSYRAIGSFDQRNNVRNERDEIGGDKLFRNDQNLFTDVTEEAGIYSSVIGFGLGVTVGDVNSDGWQDIYISNDFFERDYLYINNQEGGFEEVLEQSIKSTSAASMGADMADLDNDSHPEIFVTDMLPDKNDRVKTVTTFDSWDRYIDSYNNGYWHQFTRNTLHYNNGDGTFSEIGRYAGIEASDWSWASIIFDFQNDGFKDIFIANGIYQDLTNQDFLVFVTREEVTMQITMGGRVDFETLISYIPSNPIPNHAYVNNGDLTFTNGARDFGFFRDSFSSGSAYGDLDNDGDLDLVVNNTNMPFFLYENRTESRLPENHFLRFRLNGEKANKNAIGARIKVWTAEGFFQVDNMPNRGFESSVDNRPHVGIGKSKTVDSVEIWWPSGKKTKLLDLEVDKEHVLNEADGEWPKATPMIDGSESFYAELDSTSGFDFVHSESEYSDFDRENLIFRMISSEGPCICTGDINNDGLEDIFIGGARGYLGQVYAQEESGGFRNVNIENFNRTKDSEDVSCVLFDANGDGNLDLYVASGSNEYNLNALEMNDRLFFGDGNFGFELVRQTLPAGKFESSSVVESADFDKDGDMDLFVGVRLKPFFYGVPTNGYLLENDGTGTFTNISQEIAPELDSIGMITDATWTDLDQDEDLDLVIVGEWMPISIFINEDGKFRHEKNGMPNSSGWWNVIAADDLNGDGLPDLVVGNHGLNTRFEASVTRPVKMYVNDFDGNGTVEQVLCQYEDEQLYPMSLKHDLAKQMPFINEKYRHYESFKNEEVSDIFGKAQLRASTELEAKTLATSIYLNNGDMTFEKVELPPSVQFSTTNAVLIDDLNDDGRKDVLLGGNFYDARPEVGRYDASYGVLLIGNGRGGFRIMPVSDSGLMLDRQVKGLRKLDTKNGTRIIVANNDDAAQIFSRRE